MFISLVFFFSYIHYYTHEEDAGKEGLEDFVRRFMDSHDFR